MYRRIRVGYLWRTATGNKQVSWHQPVLLAKLPDKFKRHQRTHAMTEKCIRHAEIGLENRCQHCHKRRKLGKRNLPETVFASRKADTTDLDVLWQVASPCAKNGRASACIRKTQ